jgi:head-tail adaptor
MSLASLLSEQVIVIHPGVATDAYGNPVPSWASGAASGMVPAAVQQSGGAEQTTDRDTPVSDWLLVVPADTDLSAYDRVLWQDLTFEVVGRPAPWSTPRGPHHLEARLRLIE